MAALFKVAKDSNPSALAGALAGTIREQGSAEMQAVGAASVNQAVKATAIARGFLAPQGYDLVCIPGFADIVINGEERTCMKLRVERR